MGELFVRYHFDAHDKPLDDKLIRWSAENVGKWIRHHGWTLKLPANARVTWPVCPFNPYRNGPETELAHAVGVVSLTLTGKQELLFAVETDLFTKMP